MIAEHPILSIRIKDFNAKMVNQYLGVSLCVMIIDANIPNSFIVFCY